MLAMPGRISVTSGYSGGSLDNPTYENHKQGAVSHVEVVEVIYDPARQPYRKVLDYFLRNIDPTDGGGQNYDRGPSYRPVIFVADAAERAEAEAAVAAAERKIGTPLEVDILPFERFYAAEDPHQRYAEKNPQHYKAYRVGSGRDANRKKVWGEG
jgi:methionine-S-sulfoxide reductase